MPVPNNIPIPGTIGDNVDFSDFAGKNTYSPFSPPSNNTQFQKRLQMNVVEI